MAGAIAGYEYRVNGGAPQDLGLLMTVAGGLAPATTYGFEVRAYDTSGNRGAWSMIANGTTLPVMFLTNAAGDQLLNAGGDSLTAYR